MSISEAIKQRMTEIRESKSLDTVKLPYPDEYVADEIQRAGGSVVRTGYDRWCHSDTCAHNSHDEGMGWTEYEVPKEWLEERPDPDVFNYDEERYSGVFIIPSEEGPVAIIKRDYGQGFADTTTICYLRPKALEAWKDLMSA